MGCGCATGEGKFHKCLRRSPGRFYADIDANDNFCAALLVKTIRHTFGLGTARSASAARATARVFTDQGMINCTHKVMSELITQHVTGHWTFPKYFAALSDRPGLSLSNVKDSDLDQLWIDGPHFRKELAATFLAMRYIAWDEGWESYGAWRRRAILSEMELLSIDFNQLSLSQSATGLRQNEFSASGIIIPHSIIRSDVFPESLVGLTRLDGIRYTATGKIIDGIEPIGVRDADTPIMLTQEDFTVALCLAFCESDPIKAGISIEQPPKHFLNARISSLMYKVFTPKWLAATDFGGSLYLADFMAGACLATRGLMSLS